MVEKTGFVPLLRDYAVFVIVTGMGGGIPLVIERGNFAKKMWKLPGGRPSLEDGMDKNITAMREVNDEIGIVVEYPEREVLRIPKKKHDFIVLKAKYFNGELMAKAEIERVSIFTLDHIKQLVGKDSLDYILPDHAEALRKYLGEEAFLE